MNDSLEQFGRYLLRGRLAFGGMAEIFLAELRGEEGFARRLVVKRILPQYCADPGFVRMFVDEAVLAALISHPNIVQVFDFGHVEDVYFIAMEHVDGVDLRRIVGPTSARPRLTAAETAAIGEAVARGLSHAHNLHGDDGQPLHLVHRDVTPHNIMIARTGEVKLMDFGIAKAEARVTRTATGMIKGKLAYMSPEQAGGRPLDKRSDQFGLGVVLWECLAGERLFAGASDLEVLNRVVHCQVRPLTEVCADVPEVLAQAIGRCLAVDPAQRFADLAELADLLAAFRFSLGAVGAVNLASLVPAATPPPVGQPRRTLPLDPPSQSSSGWEDNTQSVSATAPAEGEAEEIPAGTTAPARLEGEAALPPTRQRRRRRSGSPSREKAARGVRWRIGGGLACAVLTGLIGAFVLHQVRGARGDLNPPQLSVAVGMLLVESDPPGARVLLDGRDTGLRTPVSLPVTDPAMPLALSLQRDGYLPWLETVFPRLARGAVRATLAPKPPTVVLVTAPPLAATPTPDDSPVSSVKKAGVSARSGNRRTGKGRLSLRATGAWVEVFHAGERLGTTPLNRVEVPAGRLRLRLVNGLVGIDRVIDVDVGVGEEVRKTIITK